MQKVRFKQEQLLPNLTATIAFPNIIEPDFYDRHYHIWAKFPPICIELADTNTNTTFSMHGMREMNKRSKILARGGDAGQPIYMQYIPGTEFAWTVFNGHYIMATRKHGDVVPEIRAYTADEVSNHDIFSKIPAVNLPFTVCGVLVDDGTYMHMGTVDPHGMHIMLPYKAELFPDANLQRVLFSNSPTQFPLSVMFTNNWRRGVLTDPKNLYEKYLAYLDDISPADKCLKTYLMRRTIDPIIQSYTQFVRLYSEFEHIKEAASPPPMVIDLSVSPRPGSVTISDKAFLDHFFFRLNPTSSYVIRLHAPSYDVRSSPITRGHYAQKHTFYDKYLNELIHHYSRVVSVRRELVSMTGPPPPP